MLCGTWKSWCSAVVCSIVLMSSSYIAVTGGIIELLVLLCRDAGAEYYPYNIERRALQAVMTRGPPGCGSAAVLWF